MFRSAVFEQLGEPGKPSILCEHFSLKNQNSIASKEVSAKPNLAEMLEIIRIGIVE
jgi:hypothetical protein